MLLFCYVKTQQPRMEAEVTPHQDHMRSGAIDAAHRVIREAEETWYQRR